MAARRGDQRRAGENLDLAHVASYDDKADAGATAEVALLVDLGLDARSHVIDLVAGTGQFSVAVASSCARVLAVDVSPVMLEPMIERSGFSIEQAT